MLIFTFVYYLFLVTLCTRIANSKEEKKEMSFVLLKSEPMATALSSNLEKSHLRFPRFCELLS